MARRYKLVSDDELKDYRAWLDWYGYSERDFQLSESIDSPEKFKAQHPESIDSPEKSKSQHPGGWVRVYRKSAGVKRNYRVGVGLRWTAELEDDLRKGAFKQR